MNGRTPPAFGGSLSVHDAQPLKNCQTVRISAFGARLAVGCITVSPKSRTAQRVRFFASADQGQSWTEEPFVSRASSELRLASGADGALLVTGICPPHQSRAGCVPSGIYFRGRSPRGLTRKKTSSAAWTLEIFCVQPIRIYAGVQICQIFYHTIEGDYDAYSSTKYQNNTGIQHSMLFREFDSARDASSE